MQAKNIRVTGAIPPETPALKDLTYRFTSKPGDETRQTLKAPVDSKIVYLSEEELRSGLAEAIPDLEQYSFDPEVISDKMFVFYRLTDTFPIFDVKLELYHSNQKITAFHQDLVEIIPSDEAKGQTVLSAAQAIASLIDKYVQANSVIKEIRLGYHGQFFDSDTQVAAPSWRALLEDGTVYYVDAISGKVDSNQDNPSSTAAGERTGQS
jgi:regulatory protein YycI of two-component signal transduction system YycFG